jgi:hypothetical protein
LEELNLILFLKTLGIGGISELVLKAIISNEKYIFSFVFDFKNF